MFYSKTTGGFYNPAIHGNNIPADAVEITGKEHAALLVGQSQGKQIVADKNGKPVLADPPAPTDEELGAQIRADRDRRIEAVMWRYERIGRHYRLGLPMLDDMATLDAYVQALADVPEQPGFPHDVSWPVEP